MKLSEIIENLEAIVSALKVGNDSGQRGPSLPIIDSSKSKYDPYKNLILEQASPTASSPTPSAVQSRGSRMVATWMLGDIGLNYALSKGLSAADAQHEAEKFKSHFLAASGPNAIKRDWLQAWQVWVLNSLNKYGVKPAHTLPTQNQPALSEEKRAELAAKYSKKIEP